MINDHASKRLRRVWTTHGCLLACSGVGTYLVVLCVCVCVCRATPHGVQAVLDMRPGTFDRPKQLCDPIIQSGFDGVLVQNGETWKRHRRMTSSAFR
jgi:hypothetical protein